MHLRFRMALGRWAAAFLLSASVVASAEDGGLSFGALKEVREFRNVRGDNWRVVGRNLVLSGNVRVPCGNYYLRADKVVINTETREAEAAGDVRMYRSRRRLLTVDPEDLPSFRRIPNALVRVDRVGVQPDGRPFVQLEIEYYGDMLKAEHALGNLTTGLFQLGELECRLNDVVFRAKKATRKPGGEIELKDAELSTCEYLSSGRGHYSIACGDAKIYPHETDGFAGAKFETANGQHSLWAYNCLLKVYGVPVFWLPVVYKPKDERLGMANFRFGSSSDWGYFLSLDKTYEITDYPRSTLTWMADLYSKRGFGFGAETNIVSENSKTTIFAYNIYDTDPYRSSEVRKYRLDIPSYRYDLRISNVTHITPRLDFRGNFELLSDMYFLHDYFSYQDDANPQPETYGALEYQGDWFSASLNVRAKVNSFFSEVNRYPEFRFEIPRMELFGTNLYYQSQTRLGYYLMDWREFDGAPLIGSELNNYQAFRFDTVHFLYYPMKFFDWLNVVPRAGGRYTFYDKSSDTAVSNDALLNLFAAETPDSQIGVIGRQYDDRGGTVNRFLGEIGLEMNTKIYRSWQDVRSSFLRLDGLRHVMEPYLNYTYITNPSEDRDHIYYFDDIDRIEKRNFVRLGIVNRLQTRASDNQLREYFTMENYWDYHFEDTTGVGHYGEFCTKLTFSPCRELSLSTLFAIDVGSENAHDTPTYRDGKAISRAGIGGSFLNRWNFSIRYEPIKDFIFNLSYSYHDVYKSNPVYSMGSTFTQLEAGSYFSRNYGSRVQQLTFGMQLPIWRAQQLFGRYVITYDFEAGFISEQRFGLLKRFHCWDVGFEYIIETEYDENFNHEPEQTFMFTAQLTNMRGLFNTDRVTQTYNDVSNNDRWSGR